MIDINELRRLLDSRDMIDGTYLHANIKPIIREMLGRLEEAERERDALRAEIEAMERQEPVGHVYRHGKDYHGRQWHGIVWYDPNLDVQTGSKLFLLPGAKGEEK